MGLLVGFQKAAQIGELVFLGVRDRKIPELAFVLEWAFDMFPNLEDDVQRLSGHLPMLARLHIDVEKLMIRLQPTGTDAEHIPTLSQVVEKGNAVSQLHRMVEGKKVRACSQLDILRSHQGLSDQDVGRRHRLPRRGEMLTDPRLVVPVIVRHL